MRDSVQVFGREVDDLGRHPVGYSSPSVRAVALDQQLGGAIMAAPERQAGGGRAPEREELIEALRSCLARISDGKLAPADIQPGCHVFDYGYVDSLSAVMFLAQIEENYGVRIDDVDLVERYNTLEAIADCIRGAA